MEEAKEEVIEGKETIPKEETKPEISESARELQKGDRCMVGKEEILDANDIVKESFQRSQFERKMLFIQRRRRRRKEYRKKEKLKNGIVVEVEETIDKYVSNVKMKKSPDKKSDIREVGKEKNTR
jgi:uncharacterized protein YajQ (UPF0234 family)